MDSLQWVREGKIVRMVGCVSGKWASDDGLGPMVSIPTAVSLNANHSTAKAFIETYLETIVRQVGTAATRSLTGKVSMH